MNPLFTFIIFAALGCALWVASNRLIMSGRVRTAKAVQSAAVIVGLFSVYPWHREEEKRTADSISATLLVLEKRIQEDDKRAALEIIDRFGHPANLACSAEALRTFADSLPEKKKNNVSAMRT